MENLQNHEYQIFIFNHVGIKVFSSNNKNSDDFLLFKTVSYFFKSKNIVASNRLIDKFLKHILKQPNLLELAFFSPKM